MRALLQRLPIDDLVGVLLAVAARLALRGLLNRIDIAVIRAITDDIPDQERRIA